MSAQSKSQVEWLESDGLGGFASGSVDTIRTRRYHALLLAATRPPTARMVLVNGLELWAETAAGSFALCSHRYAPDVTYPDGAKRIVDFTPRPWPRWRLLLPDGILIEQGIIVAPGRASTLVYWRCLEGQAPILLARPLISGRDYHSLHRENAAFNFNCEIASGRVIVRPYDGVPPIVFDSNAQFVAAPEWYRNFFYQEERERGLDCIEDLAAPGVFRWDLARQEAFLAISAQGHEPGGDDFAAIRAAEERRRSEFAAPILAAADSYIVRRGAGRTIIAGYPWFTDWGRDTFISMRGLCLAIGKFEQAREILLQWAEAVSQGMLPNRFTDAGEEPEFNSVDASLWYIVAVHDFLAAAPRVSAADRRKLDAAVTAILEGYAAGTRYSIRMDPGDSLLAAGQDGVQLTWMDAKAGDWVVTPRIGKPVEVQALWLNALAIAAQADSRWKGLLEKGTAAFAERFFDPERGCLFDVVDAGHRAGEIDRSFRPNQIFAVGGLPYPILSGPRAEAVVNAVQAKLLTPVGLRSLAADDPNYRGRYHGDQRERDGAYHQGTVWPWLLGPFIEAWLRVRGTTRAAKDQARERFLAPMLAALDPMRSGHLPEIADGDPPHAPQGCPFQAWSVGEALRISRLLE